MVAQSKLGRQNEKNEFKRNYTWLSADEILGPIATGLVPYESRPYT